MRLVNLQGCIGFFTQFILLTVRLGSLMYIGWAMTSELVSFPDVITFTIYMIIAVLNIKSLTGEEIKNGKEAGIHAEESLFEYMSIQPEIKEINNEATELEDQLNYP